LENDVPVLIEQGRMACLVLDESVKRTAHSLDGLAQLSDTVQSRLDSLEQQAEATIQTVDRTLNDLEALVGQLLGDLQAQMEATGSQADLASTGTDQSMSLLGTASAALAGQAQQSVSDNYLHDSHQQQALVELQGQLDRLLASLDEATGAAIKEAASVNQGVDDKHETVVKASGALQEGFGGFTTGVNQQRQKLQDGLSAAGIQTQQQLDEFQARMQQQLDQATKRVRELLESSSQGLNRNTDGVEQFLEGLLKFLETTKSTVSNQLKPPVVAINRAQDALNPILNLLGTLRDIGLI